MSICIAPCRDHTSKVLRYGTCSQRDFTVLPAHHVFICNSMNHTCLNASTHLPTWAPSQSCWVAGWTPPIKNSTYALVLLYWLVSYMEWVIMDLNVRCLWMLLQSSQLPVQSGVCSVTVTLMVGCHVRQASTLEVFVLHCNTKCSLMWWSVITLSNYKPTSLI